MKAKGLKLSAIIFAIGAMLLALVGIYTPSASVMASSSSSQNSSWMKTENGYEKTANTAGSTSGYDKYILGEKNVTLSTQANEGYDLLAWLVLDSSNNKVAELTPTSKTGTVTVDGVDANLTATFEDVDEDGLFDNGEFTISQVLKELRVEPIFGYTYYTLDVTSFAPISNIASEKLIINPAVYVYDESNASLTVETLQNMFVVKGESTSGGFEIKEAYYFETIYKEQGSDAYFVVQNGERVDCLQGAYTLGQQIDIETGVSAGTLMQGVGVTLVTNTTSKLVQNTEIKVVNAENAIVNNSVYFEKDAKNLTTKIAGKFVIAKAYDRINKLELNYHKVYKVELKVNLEGSEASGAILTDLLSVIKVENYVAKETDAFCRKRTKS